MFVGLSKLRKFAAAVVALGALMWVTACDVPTSNGPRVDRGAPVPVALLVPGGSEAEADIFLAQNLESAARMAISDLSNVTIDLRVYHTGADAAQAAQVATQAVDEGAKIILGPLYAEAANAAGVAVAPRGVSVLAFSNNTAIAGGNVFVLGSTFRNSANRLTTYLMRQGRSRIMIVYGDDLQGAVGRDAIDAAARARGAMVMGALSYPLSQQGIIDTAGSIADQIKLSGADTIFFTGGVNADLPLITTALTDHGIAPGAYQFVGLTRWNAAPQALALPSLQGGLFALPDPQTTTLFDERYRAIYGSTPHALAGLAYDGIAAIGALVAEGGGDALSRQSLLQPSGFQGTSGIFRFLSDGSNERGLAIATVEGGAVTIIEAAPRSFGRPIL